MGKYYPASNLKVWDTVRVLPADLVGYVKKIRLDEFGDEVITVALEGRKEDWIARSIELKPEPKSKPSE